MSVPSAILCDVFELSGALKLVMLLTEVCDVSAVHGGFCNRCDHDSRLIGVAMSTLSANDGYQNATSLAELFTATWHLEMFSVSRSRKIVSQSGHGSGCAPVSPTRQKPFVLIQYVFLPRTPIACGATRPQPDPTMVKP